MLQKVYQIEQVRRKYMWDAYHRRGGCFFQGVGTGGNLNKKHFL